MGLVEWQLEGGGHARLAALCGDRASIDSTRPFPVGSTLSGVRSEGGQRHELKVRGCRKTSEGRFLVEGRFVNLSRAARERLERDAAE